MLLASYVFNAQSIADLVIAILGLAAILVFFLYKKSVKLMLLYVVTYVLVLTAVLLDELYDIPIVRAVGDMLALLMICAVVVVYQSDLKIAFFNLTKREDRNTLVDSGLTDEELRKAVDEIIKACQSMSKTRTGALIVIVPTTVSNNILETGVKLDALVSSPLLEAIFNTRAPFHDGAVMIKGNKVLAAGCFLPLSQSQSVAKNLGTRHRAGIGITEETDMLTIIVSEETGIISIARHGELRRFVTPDRLRDILHETLKIAPQTRQRSI